MKDTDELSRREAGIAAQAEPLVYGAPPRSDSENLHGDRAPSTMDVRKEYEREGG